MVYSLSISTRDIYICNSKNIYYPPDKECSIQARDPISDLIKANRTST